MHFTWIGCFTTELMGSVSEVRNSSHWLGIRYVLASSSPFIICRLVVVKFGDRIVNLSLGNFWQYLHIT